MISNLMINRKQQPQVLPGDAQIGQISSLKVCQALGSGGISIPGSAPDSCGCDTWDVLVVREWLGWISEGFSSLKDSRVWNKQEEERMRSRDSQAGAEAEFVSHSSCSSKLQQG